MLLAVAFGSVACAIAFQTHAQISHRSAQRFDKEVFKLKSQFSGSRDATDDITLRLILGQPIHGTPCMSVNSRQEV